MAELATGRSRAVSSSFDALTVATRELDTTSGVVSLTAFASARGFGWQAGVDIGGGVSAGVYDPVTDTWVVTVTAALDWGPDLASTSLFHNTIPIPNAKWHGDVNLFYSLSGAATGTADYTLTEYEDLGPQYERPTGVSRSAGGSVDFTIYTVKSIASAGPVPPAGTIIGYEIDFSGSVSAGGSASSSPSGPFGVPDYRHQLVLSAGGGASARATATIGCAGIAYSRAIDHSIDGVHLSGTVIDLTLTSDGTSPVPSPPSFPTHHVANGGVIAEPDFALEATIAGRHYGGGSFSGAELELRRQVILGLGPDNPVLDTAFTDPAVLRYPSGGAYYGGGGVQSWAHWSVDNGSGFSYVWDGATAGFDSQPLSRYVGAGSGVFVKETWADDYGCDLNCGIGVGTVAGLYALPKFTAGTVAFATAHDFRLFAAATDWIGAGGAVSLDAGTWRFANVSGGIASWGDRFAWGDTGITAHGRAFLPLAYRYYTLRLKADTAGAKVTLRASMALQFGSALSVVTAEWDFTLAASGVFEDHAFDWLSPDRMTDSFRSALGRPQRYPLHPYLLQTEYEASGQGVSLELAFGTDGATYWVEKLSGAQRTDGGRVGATLHAPLQFTSVYQHVSDEDPLTTASANEAAQDVYLALLEGGGFGEPPAEFGSLAGAVGQRQGDLWGWLDANGAVGLRLVYPLPGPFSTHAGTIQDAWDLFTSLYDDAANDTGISIAVSGVTRAAREQHRISYLVEDDVLPRTPATSLTPAAVNVIGVRRFETLYGYYGMGASYENGSYGSTLEFVGDLWFDGELSLLVWKPRGTVAGATVEVLDNDAETVLDTLTSDADGVAASSLKDGRRLPLSTLPVDDFTPADHIQYDPLAALEGLAPSYTPEGLKLNSYWLRSAGLRWRDAGNVAKWPPNQVLWTPFYTHYREDFAVIVRGLSHYDVEAGAAARSPDNLTDPLNRFHRASVDDLGAGDTLMYRRSDFNTPEPGWAVETDLGPDADEPSLAIDAQDLELRASVSYTRADGVYERVSDSDAETFEDEVLVIPGGTRSRNFTSQFTADRLLAAYVAGSPGTIQAVYKGPGDPGWSSVFTFRDAAGDPLQVEDDNFSPSVGTEAVGGLIRWTISVRIAGETETSEWGCDFEPDWAAPVMWWERIG